MPAYHVFDQGHQSGPYEASQIVGMWDHGSLTATAQYFDDDAQKWCSVSDLVAATKHPFRTHFQSVAAQMNKPEAVAQRKRTEHIVYICMAVFAALFFWFMTIVERDNASTESKKAYEEAVERNKMERYQRAIKQARNSIAR